MIGISVVICCYNSGDKLISTLSQLAKQQSMPSIPYELIIVDNNCSDKTIEIATDTWKAVGCPFPIVLVQQTIAGLSFAREKGIEVARYDYVVLCDDDNWLCDNYLKTLFHLMEAMPEVALIGGVGEAVTEISIPDWFKSLNGFGYAVGNEGKKTGYVDSLYGAGMGIRRSVFLQLKDDNFSFILSDRKGIKLSSGGDTELCLLVKNGGHRIYLDDTLSFKHFLSKERLEWNYYLKLRKSFGKADAYLLLYNEVNSDYKLTKQKNRFQHYISFLKYSLSNFKYLLLPSLFQNAKCANFVQQWSMRLTLLVENKKIEDSSIQLAMRLKEKHALKCATQL